MAFEKLKKRWGIESNFSLIIIFIVFSITGSAAVWLAKPTLVAVGLQADTFPDAWYGILAYRVLRILLIFPLYQVLLVVFGTLFGQFQFFWNFEKKMLKRIGFKRFFND
jgi:hypothetical protein